MDAEQIRQIFREEFTKAIGGSSDRFLFPKHLQMTDGHNFQFGRTVGTKIATAPDQKLSFFGADPVAQQNIPLTSPTDQDIIDALIALGLAEQSD